MRKRAAELYQMGGILLRREQLEEFAREAGLPLSTLDKALGRWLQDGKDGPAFLVQISEDKDRYALGPVHKNAQNFIAQAGKDEVEGSKAGKLSRKLDRKGRRKK